MYNNINIGRYNVMYLLVFLLFRLCESVLCSYGLSVLVILCDCIYSVTGIYCCACNFLTAVNIILVFNIQSSLLSP